VGGETELEFTGGIDGPSTLRALAAHTIPGAEVHDPVSGSHTRLIGSSRGLCHATVTIGHDRVLLTVDSTDETQRSEVEATVRRWLDLDTDLAPIVQALEGDPVIGPLIAARPGLRIVGYPDGFETAILIILGQQVSLAAGRTFGGRLVEKFGSAGPGELTAFPTPEQLADVPVEDLRVAVGITGSRARTLAAVSRAFASGFTLEPDGDHLLARATLLEMHGVGPWTADCLALRVLRDPDAFPSGDLVLRKALGGVTAKEAERMSQAWRPWRAYALFHLWTSTSY